MHRQNLVVHGGVQGHEPRVIGGEVARVAVRRHDQLGVTVIADAGDDARVGQEEIAEDLGFGLGERAGSVIGFGTRIAARSDRAPAGAEVAVEIDAVAGRARPAVLAPHALGRPAMDVTVGIENRNDHKLELVHKAGDAQV